MLLGPGGTGKSSFPCAACIAILGQVERIPPYPLQKLEEDRFAVARLVGKLANIFADLPGRHLESSSVFKSITGGGAVPAERKFKRLFRCSPFHGADVFD